MSLKIMKFGNEEKAKLLDLLSQGIPITNACEAIGITTQTYYQHRTKDEAFRKAIAKVRATGISTKLAKMNEMAEKSNSWQAIAWQLERMYPEEFGKVNRMEVKATVRQDDMDAVKLAEVWGAELGISPQILLQDYQGVDDEDPIELTPGEGDLGGGSI